MKSSRSRSRNKNRNNRPSGGNVINRVFDSSGPEGKVRGTPQQIIDKYNQLARDAQLSNDRVAAENFQQHAEHYLRLLSDAQREIDARREEQERQNRERQAERDRERAERQERQDRDAETAAPQDAPIAVDPGAGEQPDIIEPEGSDLVETPEEAPKPKPKPKPRATKPRAPRKPRAPKAKADAGEESAPSAAAEATPDAPDTPEAAE